MLSIGCPKKIDIVFNGVDFDVTLFMYNNPNLTLQTKFTFYEVTSLSVLINILKDPAKRNSKPVSTKLNQDIVVTLDFNQQTIWLIKDDFYTDINKLCLEVLKLQINSAIVAYTNYMISTPNKKNETILLQDNIQVNDNLQIVTDKNSNYDSTNNNVEQSNPITNNDKQQNNSNNTVVQLTDEQIEKITEICNLSVTVDETNLEKVEQFKTYLQQYIKDLDKVSVESFRDFLTNIKSYVKQFMDGKQSVNLEEYSHFNDKPIIGDIYRKAQNTTDEGKRLQYMIACMILNEITITTETLSTFI